MYMLGKNGLGLGFNLGKGFVCSFFKVVWFILFDDYVLLVLFN